jgi:inorganic triphosphatase YgiF
MSELEIKFQVPADERAALLKAIGTRGLERVMLRARYFDTEDHLLARHEIALRLREENGAWVQTLKAATPHALERLEDNVELSAGTGEDGLSPDPERHAQSEVGERLAKLLRTNGHPALVEVYRTEVARTSKQIHAHDAKVEWSLDEGSIVAGERAREVLELELEWKGGEERGLYALAREWQARHGLWIDPISKAHRGSLLVEGRSFAPAVKSQPPELDRAMSGERLLRAMVAATLSQILPNAAEIIGGSHEPEHVHQLRVGVRRLRTAAREMKPYAAALDPEWEPPVKAVFEALGEARDRHVQRTQLAPQLERAGAPLADIAGPRSDEELLVAARDAVRATPFQAALLQLVAFAHEDAAVEVGEGDGDAGTGADADAASTGDGGAPSAPEAEAAKEIGQEVEKELELSAGSPLAHVQEQLSKLHRQVTREAGHFESLPHEEQHDVRKRLKRLRYLAQFVAPLYKSRRVEVWLNSLEPAQDALGRHIDTGIAAARFEAAAASDPRAWFAAGWLRAQLDDSAHDSRKSLERFARAAVFW